ncbi:GTPase Obg [Striga asiatica]|uniref:GTPase Obg n=1 Tax=Striga asiatica TaxID=4170 RepID=A0A5A7Q9T0_STRAF|nr:GTPase Obg [Striga asiatica]
MLLRLKLPNIQSRNTELYKQEKFKDEIDKGKINNEERRGELAAALITKLANITFIGRSTLIRRISIRKPKNISIPFIFITLHTFPIIPSFDINSCLPSVQPTQAHTSTASTYLVSIFRKSPNIIRRGGPYFNALLKSTRSKNRNHRVRFKLVHDMPVTDHHSNELSSFLLPHKYIPAVRATHNILVIRAKETHPLHCLRVPVARINLTITRALQIPSQRGQNPRAHARPILKQVDELIILACTGIGEGRDVGFVGADEVARAENVHWDSQFCL